MNFMEAVKAMKEGKKVGRKRWSKNDFCFLKEVLIDWSEVTTKKIYRNDDRKSCQYFPNIKCIEATDWELVGEKKTLSDKIKNAVDTSDNVFVPKHLYTGDVCEHLKSSMNKITKLEVKYNSFLVIRDDVFDILREEFGKELM